MSVATYLPRHVCLQLRAPHLMTSSLYFVGQNPVGSGGKYGVVIPYNAGFTDVGVPGYSFYWGVPSKWFKDEMKAAGRTRWAASEWNLRGKNEAAW